MSKIIKNHFFPVVLFVITAIICIQNYSFGTLLSGWDTLHPEFNLNLNLQRVIFGVFRENQGLGALAAHAHMSELPRILLLYILKLVLPLSFLRYSYVFLCLILGPLGVYYFLKKFVVKDTVISFLGALFYLLNLGTMQQFIVPFEMFTTQYAFLPWIFYFATDYLETDRKKNLILFSAIMFLSSPIAYAPVLWYLTLASLISYLAIYALPEIIRGQFKKLKKPLLLIILALAINAYWILPNLYFVATSAKNVSEANINKLFSEQAFLYNKEFGTTENIAFLKTFLFDWSVYKGADSFEKLLSPWIQHLQKPLIYNTGIFLALLSIAGFSYAAVKKQKIAFSLGPTLLICLFFLFNDNPPFSPVYVFFQNNLPLFKEALRFPDDKVLGLFTFVFSVFFAYGLLLLIKLLEKIHLPGLFSRIFLSILFSGLLVYFMLPAFQGNFISPYMRINIPKEYFAMFKWFDNQKDTGRITNLPINSFWGWEYYNWYGNSKPSYQGAGFIWFGIKQPLLARDFDRWNKYNEQYYREMSYAVYSKNTELFEAVLSKYNIHYLLLDKNIIAPENDPKVLFYNETEELLGKMQRQNKVDKTASFGNKIAVYEVKNQKQNTHLADNLIEFSPVANSYYEDFVYSKNGDYIAMENNNQNTDYFPFRNIIDNQSKLNKDLFKLTQNGIQILSKNPVELNPLSLLSEENNIPADLVAVKNGQNIEFNFYPRLPNGAMSTPLIYKATQIRESNLIFSFNQKSVFVFPKLAENSPFLLGTVFLSTKSKNSIELFATDNAKEILPDFSKLLFTLSSCEAENRKNVFGLEPGKTPNSFFLITKETPLCLTIPLSQFEEQIGPLKNFLINISYGYSGKPLSNACIAYVKNGECVNIDLKQFTKDSSVYSEIDNIKDYSLKIFLDSTNNKSLEKVNYTNFSFKFSAPEYTAAISNELLTKSLSENKSTEAGKLTIPYTGDIQLSKDITVLPKNNISCGQDPFYINRDLKKEIYKKESENFIRYESGQGPACDHFSYKNLSHQQAYLIIITSRNLKGLPLSLCILNHQSRRCEVYSSLSRAKNEQFAKDVFLAPPSYDGGLGYDINISNTGIKGSPAINDLESIQIIPFPYLWLSNLEIQGKNTKSGVLALTFGYSYDPGWTAYQVKTKNVFTEAFPFVSGKQLKNHVLINNWANGWILNSDANCQSSIENCKIIIVYWPQYLEYLGFAALLLSPILLYVFRSKV